MDDFKKIITSNEKRKVLLRGNCSKELWFSMEGEPIIENDSIKIMFFAETQYSAEFVRNVDTNQILIKTLLLNITFIFFSTDLYQKEF